MNPYESPRADNEVARSSPSSDQQSSNRQRPFALVFVSVFGGIVGVILGAAYGAVLLYGLFLDFGLRKAEQLGALLGGTLALLVFLAVRWCMWRLFDRLKAN